ncbi:hypothetical protein BLNAU_13833 [Blattamonas nauphoetae]|uniref:Uncharacterized protein n=1 Tax=Blattamonas nauphoetae TaxID=2049346 RepID=A0ABQ9XFH0_9EUKA|nr:hypothetical protein BLNAU_13833 [Blattamonas nauphoetae]
MNWSVSILNKAPLASQLCEHAVFGTILFHSSLRREQESTPLLVRPSHSQLFIALVKAAYPFDSALQDRAAQFLKCLEPKWRDKPDHADNLVTDLVPSSDGSHSGFIDSIVILLSSPHSSIVEATMSFLNKTTTQSSPAIRKGLVESDLINKLLATVRPHTLPLSGNDEIFNNLTKIIGNSIYLASPKSLSSLHITTSVDKQYYREMIFQKVVIASGQFVSFLISNRYSLDEDLLFSFMSLLATGLRISLFHRPTLEFVLASPIAMTLSSCLSFFEDDHVLWMTLNSIQHLLKEWEEECLEVVQSGKRILHALFSEGFEDTLEHLVMNDKGGDDGRSVDDYCRSVTRRSHLSRMAPTHFCGLSSDVGDAVIAGPDEQILRSPPIVQKCAAVFYCHIVNRPLSTQFIASLNDAL